CAPSELDHILGRRGDIIIVDRRGDEYPIGGFDGVMQVLRPRHSVAFVGIAQWEIHFADIDPIAIDFPFLQMSKSDPSHSAAVAIGIAASADYKMLRHAGILEVNAQRSTSNAVSIQ